MSIHKDYADQFEGTEEEAIETMLTHERSSWREIGAMQNTLFTRAQYDRGLADEVWDVRAVWADNMDFIPTPEQVEAGITDEEWEVRWRWLKRTDYTPTRSQLQRLIDEDEEDELYEIQTLGIVDKWQRRIDEAWILGMREASCDILSSESDEEYYTSI